MPGQPDAGRRALRGQRRGDPGCRRTQPHAGAGGACLETGAIPGARHHPARLSGTGDPAAGGTREPQCQPAHQGHADRRRAHPRPRRHRTRHACAALGGVEIRRGGRTPAGRLARCDGPARGSAGRPPAPARRTPLRRLRRACPCRRQDHGGRGARARRRRGRLLDAGDRRRRAGHRGLPSGPRDGHTSTPAGAAGVAPAGQQPQRFQDRGEGRRIGCLQHQRGLPRRPTGAGLCPGEERRGPYGLRGRRQELHLHRNAAQRHHGVHPGAVLLQRCALHRQSDRRQYPQHLLGLREHRLRHQRRPQDESPDGRRRHPVRRHQCRCVAPAPEEPRAGRRDVRGLGRQHAGAERGRDRDPSPLGRREEVFARTARRRQLRGTVHGRLAGRHNRRRQQRLGTVHPLRRQQLPAAGRPVRRQCLVRQHGQHRQYREPRPLLAA